MITTHTTVAVTKTIRTAITIPAIAPSLSPPVSEVGSGVPGEAKQHKIITWGNTVEPLNSERIGTAIFFLLGGCPYRGTNQLKSTQRCIGICDVFHSCGVYY